MTTQHTPTDPHAGDRSSTGRRTFLIGAAGTAAAGALVALDPASPAATAAPGGSTGLRTPAPRPSDPVVTPEDSRYLDLMTGNNARFVAEPEYVRLISSARDAEAAVRAAVRTGKKVSVRSGGHCFADFVCNPEVEVILDLSTMTNVYYDEGMRAFAVEPGARLLHVYEKLFKGWGVTIPGGICYGVGAGGHIAGGGYGLLSRSHGLVVDHLYAVEVVTVDARGRVRTRVATRDSRGALGDLWWAHTGGGGGNFGIVTKYWFRSPGAHGTDPAEQLVKAPSRVLVSALSFPWDEVDRPAFDRLMTNWNEWHERYRGPGTPESHLSSLFNLNHRAHGSLGMFTQIDADAPDAAGVLRRFIEKITDGVAVTAAPMATPSGELAAMPEFFDTQELSWMQATRTVATNNPTINSPTSRGMHKSAYFKKGFTPQQLDVMWEQLRRPDFTNPDTMMVVFSFGGQVNAVSPDATANVQRDSIFKICLQTFWQDESDDEFYLGWERETFEAMFARTGGVPVPDDAVDGCYINYPDTDMADPARNRSGVPWSTLYYKDNYPRLQRAKQEWDPRNFFTHSLGIELPETTSR
ncbi:FAD-binding oxidoreductase [Myceligenerans xiligouense]|uniref:FAD/FMN-containing dehydrogenase n=1 Tax=Myceligenerans xiligouense TaxID=253184 RepID=A0A3N4YQJ1_9MICO|nr:FAD-binding protein [Myceligenerans xiligouense]RPF21614.1 FAD/FMN-containing dehydrogenase [Myceligenerans xiligouense]